MADRAGSGYRELRAVEHWHRPRLVPPLVLAVAGVLVTAALGLPRETAPLPAVARHAMEIALPRWGSAEPVSEVVYGSRGFDTFGETFLLLAAVVAVVVLTRTREARAEYVGESAAGEREQRRSDPDEGEDAEERQARAAERREEDDRSSGDRRADGGSGGDEPGDGGPAPGDDPDTDALGAPGPERVVAMSVVVRVAARAAAPVLAVIAVYLAALGYTPGGGFPAGAALAGVAILLYAALGYRRLRGVVRPAVLEPVEMLGAAAIVAVGLLGIALRGSMFANWLPLAEQQTIRAGGTLQLFSGAELVEVGTGLTIAIFAMLGMEHDWARDSGSDADADEDVERR